MNLESKLIVKYGIPGWYFVFSLFVISKIIGIDAVAIFGITNDVLFSVVITVIGVPVGYILYQVYFLSTHKEYKDDTPNWNVFVYQSIDREDRDYVSGRYAHMLRGIHEIGTLRVTFLISGWIVYAIYFLAAGFYADTSSVLKIFSFIRTKEFIIMIVFTLINMGFAQITKKNCSFKQSELDIYINGIKKEKEQHLN